MLSPRRVRFPKRVVRRVSSFARNLPAAVPAATRSAAVCRGAARQIIAREVGGETLPIAVSFWLP
jgi:hypothetical protein